MMYNNSNDGPAIANNITAGMIVQTNSITEPCVKYLYAIGFLLLL